MRRRLIAAWAETGTRPGKRDHLVWVLWYNPHTSTYELDARQAEELTTAEWQLFDASKAVHRAMTGAVKRAIEKEQAHASYETKAPSSANHQPE